MPRPYPLRSRSDPPRTCGGGRYGAAVIATTDTRTRTRGDRSVIAFLAFIGVLMAFGIDAALPAFYELLADFDLDARGISPAITGTSYFA